MTVQQVRDKLDEYIQKNGGEDHLVFNGMDKGLDQF